MRITIHRGINQIGGCITEIATATSKILIDLGHNLPKGDRDSEDEQANPTSIGELTKDCQAIFYTHYHGDHVDLFKYVPTTVEQYIGATAKLVMQCKNSRLSKIPIDAPVTPKDLEKLSAFKTYSILKKITKGDIAITPFMVNHSACDAYMFLIEADGKRVLHTGDFRGHGHTSKGLVQTIEKYIIKKPIDVLITEGTMLSRPSEKVKSERDLIKDAKLLMHDYKYVFVLCSSTDIDRLATFHTASKDEKRSFLCDGYQKEVLDIFSNSIGTKPSLFSFDNTYFYKHKNADQFETIQKKGFCMLVRYKQFQEVKDLLAQLPSEQVYFIYSMWNGYLDGENKKKEYLDLWNLFDDKHRGRLHTSGHATLETLAEVCNLVNPRTAIIPIHSEFSDKFSQLDITKELKEKITLSSCIKDNIQIII